MSAVRYLVTGGAGFIGSHMVERLLTNGAAVTVLDNLSTGSRDNLRGMSGDLRLVEGDITRAEDVQRAAQGVAGIVHLAALPSVVASVENPMATHHSCATGTLQVLDIARHLSLRVVYAGSSSAYGDHSAPAKHEDLRESPLSPYAAGKLAGELYCRSFAVCYQMTIVVTRFFNVFGPRQVANSPYSGVIAAFCRALLDGKPPRIDGDGLQSRDFTYVADIVRGMHLALTKPIPQGCHTVNLAVGRAHTVRDLLVALAQQAGVAPEAAHGPARVGDVRDSLADVRAARELLGFGAEVPFAEGLKQTYDWYRSTFGHPSPRST